MRLRSNDATRFLVATLAGASLAAAARAQSAAAPTPAASVAPAASTTQSQPRKLAIANKVWTGDFDKLLERRMIRVFAPYSRSLYFNDKGRERGIAVELVRDWERYLNIKYAKQLGSRPVTVYTLPATRDRLLPDVNEGM